MKYINTIELAGIVGTCKETLYQENRRNVRFSLAVDAAESNTVATTWFNCSYWGNSIIEKGQSIHIKGRMECRRYTDSEGKERVFYEVRVHSIL